MSSISIAYRGRNVYIQFSSHQELTTMDQNTQGRGDEVSFALSGTSFLGCTASDVVIKCIKVPRSMLSF